MTDRVLRTMILVVCKGAPVGAPLWWGKWSGFLLLWHIDFSLLDLRVKPEDDICRLFTFPLTFHGKSDKVKARQVIPAPGCSNPFRKTRLNCLSGFGWKAIE